MNENYDFETKSPLFIQTKQDAKKNIPMSKENKHLEKPILSCSLLVQSAVEMRQKLTKTSYNLEELMRIYIGTPIADNFLYSSHCSTDFGDVKHLKIKRKVRKRYPYI